MLIQLTLSLGGAYKFHCRLLLSPSIPPAAAGETPPPRGTPVSRNYVHVRWRLDCRRTARNNPSDGRN